MFLGDGDKMMCLVGEELREEEEKKKIKPVQAFSFRYDADRPLILCAKSSSKKKNPQTGHLHFSLLSDIHVMLLLENKTWIKIWSGLFTLIK